MVLFLFMNHRVITLISEYLGREERNVLCFDPNLHGKKMMIMDLSLCMISLSIDLNIGIDDMT